MRCSAYSLHALTNKIALQSGQQVKLRSTKVSRATRISWTATAMVLLVSERYSQTTLTRG